MGRLYIRDGKHWLDYIDAGGKRVRRVGSSDKSVATRMLADAESAAEKIRAGILVADPREGRRELSVHFEDYLADLERRGRDQMYRYIIKKHLAAAAEQQKWACLLDITPRGISAFLQHLTRAGRSAKTVNDYRGDISAFFVWAVQNRLVESNPCQFVPKSAIRTEKKRRALSVFECRALLKAAPADRRIVYHFLMFTGLRRAEAAALQWGHIHLDCANPHVEVPASVSKSGRHETVPLVDEVAQALEAHRGRAPDHAPVFAEIPEMSKFREDLAAAEIKDKDSRGRAVVLHSSQSWAAVVGVLIAGSRPARGRVRLRLGLGLLLRLLVLVAGHLAPVGLGAVLGARRAGPGGRAGRRLGGGDQEGTADPCRGEHGAADQHGAGQAAAGGGSVA